MEVFLFVFNTIASTTGFIVVVLGISFVLYSRKKELVAGMFLLYSALLMGAVYLLKIFFSDPRPGGTLVETSGYGLPSGHATGVMYLALCMCIFASRLSHLKRYSIYLACALFAVAVGVSRVYLYAHTPTQVFAGFALGAVWALGWLGVWRWWK